MAECSDSVVSNNTNITKQSNVVQNADLNRDNRTQTVMEPIFVDDFCNEEYPKSIKNILNFLEQSEAPPSRNDVIVGLIYILTVESGFVPSSYKEDVTKSSWSLQKHLEYSQELPQNWKRDGTYKFSFYVQGFEQHQFKLVCCPSLDDLLVNCFITGLDDARFIIYLDTLTYFSSSSVTIHNLRLQNLRVLSYKVKESVCYPARQAIFRHYSYISNCLESLPEEIIIFIVNCLKTKDFVRFGGTCRRFNRIMKTPVLWFKRIEEDLKIRYDPNWSNCEWSHLVSFYKTKTLRHVSDFNLAAAYRSIGVTPM